MDLGIVTLPEKDRVELQIDLVYFIKLITSL